MKRAFGLIAVAGLITGYALQVLLFPPLVPVSHAQVAWWDTDWGNRYEITVDNTGNGAKTTYQVRLELTSANFDFSLIQADGDDFRVLDGDNSTILDYCLFDLDIPGETATLWWHEPTIGAGASETAYLYVNNSSATNAEDCDNAFTWHDDFKDVTALGGNLTDTDPTVFNTDGYSNPVIPLGGVGEGDEQRIREHSPVYWDNVGSQYVVLYSGEDTATGEKSVYIATSTNRTTWVKTQIIDSAAQDDNPAFLYDVTTGYLHRDDENNYLIFMENDQPADDIKLWKSASLTSGWTEFGVVMSVGASGEWDDHQVGNPYAFWPGSGTTLYMPYEGLASGAPDICDVGLATSTDWGETWTKYDDAGVPATASDPIIPASADSNLWYYECHGPIYVLLDGSTYYLGSISSTNFAGRFSTTDTPATWDHNSFTEVADGSYLKDGYHVQPFLSENSYVMYQNNAQDGLYLANVIGESSAKWLAKRYASDTETTTAQENVEEDDTLPIYIDGSDQLVVNSEAPAGTTPHSIVMYSDSAITVTDNWEIIIKMMQEDGPAPAGDQWFNISVGAGALSQPTGYTASFADSYMLLTEDPGTANSINIREITAGALGTRQGANNYPAAHANAMNERSFSYTGGTLTYTAGATTGTYADTTLQATAKQIALVQGEQSPGALSTIDWFLVRNYDGEDATQTLAVVESAPSPADPCAPA